MKVRLTMHVTNWLTAARATSGALLTAIAVAGCTGGTPSASPSIYTPHPTPQVSSTTRATGAARTPQVGQSSSAVTSSTARGTAAGSARPTATATSAGKAASPTAPTASHPPAASSAPAPAPHTPVPSATRYPGAPETGGGGTAGLQDGLLFGLGGAAILAGAGSLAYRRRLSRRLRAVTRASRDASTSTSTTPTSTPTSTSSSIR